MTHIPFEDTLAFDARWSDQGRMRELAAADPLLFAADHVMLADRSEGSIALHVALRDGPSTLACITGGPKDPPDRDCVAVLGDAVHRLGGRVTEMGVVHHRLGGPGVTDLDRRWAEALKAASMAFGFRPLGVMARLYDGSLVRIDVPPFLPEDYIDRVA